MGALDAHITRIALYEVEGLRRVRQDVYMELGRTVGEVAWTPKLTALPRINVNDLHDACGKRKKNLHVDLKAITKISATL